MAVISTCPAGRIITAVTHNKKQEKKEKKPQKKNWQRRRGSAVRIKKKTQKQFVKPVPPFWQSPFSFIHILINEKMSHSQFVKKH